MPLQHRHDFAAGIHRGPLTDDINRSKCSGSRSPDAALHLDALGIHLEAGVDEGLALPQMEGSQARPRTPRRTCSPVRRYQALTDRPPNSLPYRLGMDYLLVAHHQTGSSGFGLGTR